MIAPGSRGLTLTATPLDVPTPSSRVVVLPGVIGLDVRVLGATTGVWGDVWRDPVAIPRAVELTYRTGTGEAGPASLVVLPERGRR